MSIWKRILKKTVDTSAIDNIIYNDASGARKSIPVGPHLLPLGDGASGFTTDATTARKLPSKGRSLAIYNSAGAVGSITLGDSTYPPTSQASGAIQATTNGRNVGIPCPPNAWSYISCYDQDQVISSANTLLVYLIDDDTALQQESSR